MNKFFNNQSNQSNNSNDYFNDVAGASFNQDELNNSVGTQFQKNNQTLMMNQTGDYNNYNNMMNSNSFGNTNLSQPQNNQIQQFKFNNVSSSNNNSFFKKNKKIIIIVLGIIVFLGLLLPKFKKKNISMDNGYTASSGEVIKINEIIAKCNIKVISPLEKITANDSDLFGGNYVRLGLSISNLDSDDLDVLAISMSLTDSSKKTKYIMQTISQGSDYFAYDSIGSGKTKTGYINFEYYDDNNEKNSTTAIDLSEIKYLKISVICDAKEEEKGSYTYRYSDYYLEL